MGVLMGFAVVGMIFITCKFIDWYDEAKEAGVIR